MQKFGLSSVLLLFFLIMDALLQKGILFNQIISLGNLHQEAKEGEKASIPSAVYYVARVKVNKSVGAST